MLSLFIGIRIGVIPVFTDSDDAVLRGRPGKWLHPFIGRQDAGESHLLGDKDGPVEIAVADRTGTVRNRQGTGAIR